MKHTIRTKRHPPRVIHKKLAATEPDEPLDTSIGDPDDLLAEYRLRDYYRDQELELRRGW